jgi:hypothetical protein
LQRDGPLQGAAAVRESRHEAAVCLLALVSKGIIGRERVRKAYRIRAPTLHSPSPPPTPMHTHICRKRSRSLTSLTQSCGYLCGYETLIYVGTRHLSMWVRDTYLVIIKLQSMRSSPSWSVHGCIKRTLMEHLGLGLTLRTRTAFLGRTRCAGGADASTCQGKAPRSP